MEKLWLESFEPLWVVGCNIAKDDRLNKIKGIKEFSTTLALDDAEVLTENYQKSLQRWLNGFLPDLKVFSEIIANYKDKNREAVANTLKNLAEYDKASPLGKLKRWLKER